MKILLLTIALVANAETSNTNNASELLFVPSLGFLSGADLFNLYCINMVVIVISSVCQT